MQDHATRRTQLALLHARARGLPRDRAPLRGQGDRALRHRMGRGRRVPARALQEGRRRRPAAARAFPKNTAASPATASIASSAAQELARAGSGGISASLNSHTIGAPPIARFGSEAMKARVLPPILAGEKISALAITEPGAGSDVANIKTTARARRRPLHRARREDLHHLGHARRLLLRSPCAPAGRAWAASRCC